MPLRIVPRESAINAWLLLCSGEKRAENLPSVSELPSEGGGQSIISPDRCRNISICAHGVGHIAACEAYMNEVEMLLDAVQKRQSLEVVIKIYESESGNATLGADVAALWSVQFTGGIAEFTYSYAAYLAGGERGLPYRSEVFQDFEMQFFSDSGIRHKSWIELYEQKHEFCFEVFRRVMTRRDGYHHAVASGDILRLELVEVWRENPSCRMILAKGVTAAILTLAGTFGAVHVMKTYDADRCRQEWIDYGEKQTIMLTKIGRFEGKLPPGAYDKLQDTVAGGIAACGSPLSAAEVNIGPKGVTVGVRPPPKR